MEVGFYLFGQIAVEWGLLSRQELSSCLDELNRERKKGRNLSIGDFLVEKGYLNSAQVEEILLTQRYAAQRHEDHAFGEIAMANGLATASQVAECLAAQQAEHKLGRDGGRLGEILIERGYMGRADVDAVLAAQQRFMEES